MIIDEIIPAGIRFALYIAVVAIACVIVYLIMNSGADPLITQQTGGYNDMITASTTRVLDIVETSGVF
ncbi:hypothetical protein Metho_2488 (plasmid) [Methanomethylovorans hollandica DSM 15978]|jgi:hypothetical protein|uniref:Uncharacterized protein n=1 Tax=Methanomethylovorans hollandica (strain DSM 15978 / NBRC 107637 / DMS1) TaxID=867904 RepID=L0L2H8_METHD|nr:hypothetical protein [Methanomethylovorans hollandica]AGB50628.1 hypothetical protein Metho_2488 [Methanomethylovorans hollandica DSM 15978]